MTNEILAIVTAYCACTKCCGPNAAGITASGGRAVLHRTVAGPRSLKFGTQVVINSRVYRVEDRTARRFDGRFDIYMSSHQAAKRFGKRRELVTIIAP